MRRARVIIRAAGHLLVAGLLLEVAARVDDRVTWGAPLLGPYRPEVLTEVDSGGIPRNVPGARFEKWRVNQLGFRGAEVSAEKSPGTRRVVCLGQSESFGLYEPDGAEWPARLGTLLAPRGGLEVVNASVVGLGRRSRSADVVAPEVCAAFEDHLRELVRVVRSRGAAPVLVTYPVLVDERNRTAFHLQLSDERVWHAAWSELGLVDGQRKLNEAVGRVGREQAVPVVDVAAAVPRTLEYFADVVHYTERGAAVVADHVRTGLDEAGLLGDPAATISPAVVTGRP